MEKNLRPNRMLLIWVMLFSVIHLQAQKGTISGTITSADKGVPMPGVSVTIQGTTFATLSDDNGKYNLEFSGGKGNVVFSNTGFLIQTISINNRKVINVSMVADT